VKPVLYLDSGSLFLVQLAEELLRKELKMAKKKSTTTTTKKKTVKKSKKK
jgi:hypothetical protein